MGQTLAIPEITDSGSIGLDFFLNSRQVAALQRSGVDIDHILNPFSFPRIKTEGEKKREIRTSPQIINLPTHIAPKSIKIVPKTITDSTGAQITSFVLQFLISTTSPSKLTVYFLPSQPEFTTKPHHFEPQHELLSQPIEVTLHPCINELVEITLPQCFIEFLSFQQLCQSLESQGTDIITFFGALPDHSITPTLASRALAVQNIPVAHYISLYSLSKSILAAISHIAFTIQTLLPVTTGPKVDPKVNPSLTSSLLSTAASFSNQNSPNLNDQPTIVIEWVTLQLKMNKITLVPAHLRQILSNYEISGGEPQPSQPLSNTLDNHPSTGSTLDQSPQQQFTIHPSLTIPARDSILYKVCTGLSTVQNSSTHHIHINQDCLELLDLYGFSENNGPDGSTGGPDSNLNHTTEDNTGQSHTNGYSVEPAAATIFSLKFEEQLQPKSNQSLPNELIIDNNSNNVEQYGELPYLTKVPDDCIVCMTSPATHVIYPCRHLCLCQHCAQHVITKAGEGEADSFTPGASSANTASKCPLCRQSLVCIFNLSPNGEDDITQLSTGGDSEEEFEF